MAGQNIDITEEIKAVENAAADMMLHEEAEAAVAEHIQETADVSENGESPAPAPEAKEMTEAQKELEEKRARLKAIWQNQFSSCIEFFNLVAEEVKDIYDVVPSKSKKWKSFCLIPKGTMGQLSYYSKPVNSLRVASNWNWRAPLKVCNVPNHIQCVTPDLPYVKKRPKDRPEDGSAPIWGNMVALFDSDRKYHCIFGEKYNHEDHTWTWMVNTPQNVARMLRERHEKAEKAKAQAAKEKAENEAKE